MIIFKRTQGQKNEPSSIKVRQEGKRVKVEKGKERETDKEEQRMNVTNITTGSMWERPAPFMWARTCTCHGGFSLTGKVWCQQIFAHAQTNCYFLKSSFSFIPSMHHRLATKKATGIKHPPHWALQHSVTQEGTSPSHSPSCGPCWQQLSAPAAGLGSSSVCLAGEGLPTTHRSVGTGECRSGPSVHCGPVHTVLSYPSGPPGRQG